MRAASGGAGGPRRGPRRLDRRVPGDPNLFSTARSFAPPLGANLDPEVRGYPIDFRLKSEYPEWPPAWLPAQGPRVWVSVCQWGLGCYERYLCGEGDEWLAAARAAGDYMAEAQVRGGELDGGWRHSFAMPHSYRLEPGWLSAMAQGEGASLLVRLYRETASEAYAEAAIRALGPMRVAPERGGVGGNLEGGFFPEEYPSIPGSYVLNGSLFALWGCLETATVLDAEPPRRLFDEGLETVSANLSRWDLGYWSLYDLFPHPLPNVASSAYHHLHITLLRLTAQLAPAPRLDQAAARFEAYAGSRVNVARAFTQKAAFRMVVPRNKLLAHRLPWSHRPPR